jgi:hypothetical protein|eukprot:COSAG01_NODE_388_length_17730_cov_13.231978_15_plen_78_part_00
MRGRRWGSGVGCLLGRFFGCGCDELLARALVIRAQRRVRLSKFVPDVLHELVLGAQRHARSAILVPHSRGPAQRVGW